MLNLPLRDNKSARSRFEDLVMGYFESAKQEQLILTHHEEPCGICISPYRGTTYAVSLYLDFL